MVKVGATFAVLLVGLALVAGQPFQPGQGLLPTGNLLTSDYGGPYNLSLLSTQANEIKGALAAKQNYTDADIVEFLTNVECLEGLFDTWGTFGRGFLDDLELGGPTPLGARKANLTEMTLPFLQEVALNEQGHALFTRAAGSSIPCPQVDFDGGFNKFMAAAFNLTGTVNDTYGTPFDPFKNDVNFVLSVLTLEELGATGNKGLAGLTMNPVLSTGIAGLATSANSQATVERMLLWQMRNMTVEPFNETAQQVFARVSALRDSLDGPQIDDQGLVNTDPRFIAVPDGFINMIPTDVHGLTFNRAPQMLINILTLGDPNGVGCFFPNGLNGVITKPTGYNMTASGLDEVMSAEVAEMESPEDVGTIEPPITGPTPTYVPGQEDLTQAQGGPYDDGTYLTRGYNYSTIPGPTNTGSGSTVQVAQSG